MARRKREIKLITLDTETLGLGGALKRIAIYDGQEVNYGYTFADVEKWLVLYYELGYSVHVYIHNLEFDLRKLDGLFTKGNVNWNASKVINGRYVTLACKYYTFHDSFRLLPMSLSTLSKEFDVEHGKIDLWEQVQEKYPQAYTDIGDYFERCDKDDPLYLEYLGYDVISLYEIIEKILEVSGLELSELVRKLSTASISKHVFRKGYKGALFKHKKERLTDYEIATSFKQWSSTKKTRFGISYREMEQKIRQGYFGGRTEVFTPRMLPKFGRVAGYHYDVNSLYPFVMLSHDYPVGNPEYYTGIEAELHWNNWMAMRVGAGFLKAHVFVPEQYVPPLPVNVGKLAFLTGHLEGTWTFEEVAYAVEHCGVEVLEVQEVIYFKRTFPVFENFINTFYQMKAEGKKSGNKALTQFAKLMQNTGYGYLALIRERDDVMNLEEKEKYADKILYENEELGFIRIETEVLSESIQVQIAAYVTSYARLVLLKMARRQAEKGTIYYCDTDSLVTSVPLPTGEVSSLKLGAWDLEGTLLEGFFLQPKVYYEKKAENKETIKFKGVSKDTQKEFDYEFYKSLYEKMAGGEHGRVKVEENKSLLRSISYSQKQGIDPNLVEYRDKFMNLDVTPKRDIDYKHNHSIPWHMESLQDFKDFNLSQPVLPFEQYGNLFNTLT